MGFGFMPVADRIPGVRRVSLWLRSTAICPQALLGRVLGRNGAPAGEQHKEMRQGADQPTIVRYPNESPVLRRRAQRSASVITLVITGPGDDAIRKVMKHGWVELF